MTILTNMKIYVLVFFPSLCVLPFSDFYPIQISILCRLIFFFCMQQFEIIHILLITLLHVIQN